MEEVKKHWYSKLPKWLQFILLIISLITLVYWLGFAIYKLLDAIRAIGAFIFDKRNYWTFLTCILILVVGSILLAQYYFNLDPFGKFVEWFNNWLTETVTNLREYLGELIKGGVSME